MAKQNFNIFGGHSIVKKEVFDGMTAGERVIPRATADRGVRAIDSIRFRDDEDPYRAPVERGIRVVDLSPLRAEWDLVATGAGRQLAGRVYSESRLVGVTTLASQK